MTIRILDVLGVPTKACTSFPYKGYRISMSNIMSHYVEIAIFDMEGNVEDVSVDTVEDAVAWIENNQK